MDSVLIADTSVLLNILATGSAEAILANAGWNFCVCKAVRRETLILRNRETRESVPVDLSSYVRRKLISECEPTTEREYELVVEFAALIGRGSDGEAMSFAMAESRSFPIAIDDERAVKRARQRCRALVTLRTTDVLMSWQRKKGVSAQTMGRMLQRIQLWASYFPGPRHPDYGWWQSTLDAVR